MPFLKKPLLLIKALFLCSENLPLRLYWNTSTMSKAISKTGILENSIVVMRNKFLKQAF